MRLSPFLTTVIPFSKGLAMILFIMLPFAGFWLGMRYQARIQSSVVPPPIVVPSPSENPSATVTMAYENPCRPGFAPIYEGGEISNCILLTPSPIQPIAMTILLNNPTVGYSLSYPAGWQVKGRLVSTEFSNGADCESVEVIDGYYSSPGLKSPAKIQHSFVQICTKPVTDRLILGTFMHQTYGDMVATQFQLTNLGGKEAYRAINTNQSATWFVQTDRDRIQIVTAIVAPSDRSEERLSEVQQILTSLSFCLEHDYEISICSSEKPGWNTVLLPLKDYSVSGYRTIFPSTWTVRQAGAEGMNLLFNEEKKEEVFIQITSSSLPIDQADQATYSFEMSGPDPLIDPQEKITEKKIVVIGNKTVLRVDTFWDANPYVRFFVKHDENDKHTLYMFRIKTNDQAFVRIIETMISSMTFPNNAT